MDNEREDIKFKGLTSAQSMELVHPGSILVGWRGSVAHGTYTPDFGPNAHDDKDLLGVYVGTSEQYLGLPARNWVHHIKEIESASGVVYDAVSYEVRKFISLLSQANPNVLSLLWLPEHLYVLIRGTGQWLIDHRDLFATKKAHKSFCGYANGQLHRMTHPSDKHMGAKRRELVEKFGYDCYTDDTEFLTDRGWCLYDEVGPDDHLATIDPVTGEIEFYKYVERIEKQHTGMVYEFESRHTKCRVSENHRMFASPCHRNQGNGFSTIYNTDNASWAFSSARSLVCGPRSWYHVLTAPSPCQDGNSVTAVWAELVGLYLTEGCIGYRDGKPKDLRIYQTTNGNQAVFDIMGRISDLFGFKRYDDNRVSGRVDTVWSTHDKAVVESVLASCGARKDKHFPSWAYGLSSVAANAMIAAMLAGDGTPKNGYADVYYSELSSLVDGFQALCLLAGRDSQVSCYPQHSTHQVYVRRELSIPKAMAFRSDKVLREYDGRIVCFTVPNETLVTRLDGKVALHGNTKNASHLIRILQIGIEFLSTGELTVERPDAALLIEIKRGEWSLERVEKRAEQLFAQANEALIHSPLPAEPDMAAIDELCINIVASQNGMHW